MRFFVVAKLNTLDIFNFVFDFFSERFIGLLNIIDLVLIKKWVGFSFPFWRHVKPIQQTIIAQIYNEWGLTIP